MQDNTLPEPETVKVDIPMLLKEYEDMQKQQSKMQADQEKKNGAKGAQELFGGVRKGM